MNTQLVDYGLQNEQSDVRAHVSVVKRSIFVFRTEAGREAMLLPGIRKAPARQSGFAGVTAEGYLVRPDQIKDCREVRCFPEWEGWSWLSENKPQLDTTAKGEHAVTIVSGALRAGLIPLWHNAVECKQLDLQISGTDIIVSNKCRIQVKCDWTAGSPNLYLQTAECNPLGKY
jgi:hypothetical protein